MCYTCDKLYANKVTVSTVLKNQNAVSKLASVTSAKQSFETFNVLHIC